MRRFILSSILIVALVGALGCGEDETPVDDSPVDPPATPDRDLPTAGGPEDDDYEEPPPPEEYEREDYMTNQDNDTECCQVVFAFAPRNPEEVGDAVLRGDISPLNREEGVPLEETDGVWSGEACLAPDQFGTYHYELGLLTPGSDELFLSTTYNPYAPTTTAAGEVVNAWLPEDDCEAIDVSVHAEISE